MSFKCRWNAGCLTSSACYSLIQHLCHLSFWKIKVQSTIFEKDTVSAVDTAPANIPARVSGQQQQHVCSMSVHMALNNVLVYFCPQILTNSPMLLVILKDVLISICIRSCLKISEVSSPLCSAVTYSSSCDPVTRSWTHHFFRNSVVSNKPSDVKNLWD